MLIFYLEQFRSGHEDTIAARPDIINALVSSIYIYDIEKNQNSCESSDRGSNGLGRRLVISFNVDETVENPMTFECSDLAGMVDCTSPYPNISGRRGRFYILQRGRIIVAVVDI